MTYTVSGGALNSTHSLTSVVTAYGKIQRVNRVRVRVRVLVLVRVLSEFTRLPIVRSANPVCILPVASG